MVCVCGPGYMHTHTHTVRGVLGSEHRGRDETLGEPKEYTWTKSHDSYIRLCVQSHCSSTHLYMLKSGMRSWATWFWSFKLLFIPKKTSKLYESNTKNLTPHWFEITDPPIKGTRPLFKSNKQSSSSTSHTVSHDPCLRYIRAWCPSQMRPRKCFAQHIHRHAQSNAGTPPKYKSITRYTFENTHKITQVHSQTLGCLLECNPTS